MSRPLNMHAARTALNNDPELRRWVEGWLKNKERTSVPAMTEADVNRVVETMKSAF